MKKSLGKNTLEVMDTAFWYNNWLFSKVQSYLGGNILEVGAGIGSFTNLLSKKGKVTAIDINKDYLKQKRKKINLGYGDIEKGKYFFGKGKKFNSIVCMNVLEHIKDDKKALRNIWTLLEPSGKLILLVPAHQLLYGKFDRSLGHYRRYRKKSLKVLLEEVGLKVSEMKYVNWLGAIGWFLFVKLSGKGKLPGGKVSIFDKLGKYFLWLEKFFEPPFGLSIIVISEKI